MRMNEYTQERTSATQYLFCCLAIVVCNLFFYIFRPTLVNRDLLMYRHHSRDLRKVGQACFLKATKVSYKNAQIKLHTVAFLLGHIKQGIKLFEYER